VKNEYHQDFFAWRTRFLSAGEKKGMEIKAEN
jgi:hypothetical protein